MTDQNHDNNDLLGGIQMLSSQKKIRLSRALFLSFCSNIMCRLQAMKSVNQTLLGFLIGAMSFTSVSHAGMEPWGLGFQPSATTVMDGITDLHNLLLVVITLITIFVLALMIWVMWRYRASRGHQPARFSHNTTIEIVWTVVPVIILVIIAAPSFRELYRQDVVPEPDMTIKATGYQWYWGYDYLAEGNVSFDSIMIPEDELKPGQLRLLEVDNRLVLPADTTIKLLVTAEDVIHSFAMPAFGVKTDAVPGRMNETWFRVPADKAGVYYGQCSEICGVGHAYMPIAIEILPKDQFQSWLKEAEVKFARDDLSSQIKYANDDLPTQSAEHQMANIAPSAGHISQTEKTTQQNADIAAR